jgi:RNA polymerase sigma-70 factor (ECF subfamily)
MPRARAELLAGFIDAWSGPSAAIDRERLADALVEQWQRARAALPDLSGTAAEFARHLARHVPDEGVPTDVVAQLHGEDLFLAGLCARGDADALARFDATVLAPLGPRLASIGADAAMADEVRQRLRVHLLASVDGPPRIIAFSGRARLARWIHVAAVRTFHKLTAQNRPRQTTDDLTFGFAEPTADGELEYFKQVYRTEFKEAFADAMRSMSLRDRNLLRYAIVDGLTVDQIGRIHGISRATAARHVAKARRDLVESARVTLRDRLGLAPAELHSVLRILQSELDLSVRGALTDASR